MNQNLVRAAALIEQYVSKLNTEKTTCPCCNVVKYENFDEYRSSVELTAVINKLRRRYPSLE